MLSSPEKGKTKFSLVKLETISPVAGVSTVCAIKGLEDRAEILEEMRVV